MPYPLMPPDMRLLPEELSLLSVAVPNAIRPFLPCARVTLVAAGTMAREEHSAGVEQALAKREPVVDLKQRLLYLPIPQDDEIMAVAVLTDGEPSLFEASIPWLVERARILSQTLRLLKQAIIDPATGLPNGRHLLDELDNPAPAGGLPAAPEPFTRCLILVELYPQARDAEQSLAWLTRAAACLTTLVKDSPLHHLGLGVFALLWDGVDRDQAVKKADAVLHWLKRENFGRVHIAVAPGGQPGQVAADWLTAAWQALGLARKRGPYACCSTMVLSKRQSHPLKPLAPETLGELSRAWRGSTRFALVLFRGDQEPASAQFPLTRDFWPPGGPAVQVLSAREAYVLLDGLGQDEAVAWVRAVLDKAARELGSTFSSGIALYPCDGFRKADMPRNARRALLHTEFFGPNTCTVFDSVSLNISGDIYYNEGDMAAAAGEYRKGLRVNPRNLNLLNSMGVCCAQMNRYRDAVRYFEKILEIDTRDFMALFNLGFAHLTMGEYDLAIGRFEQASGIEAENFDLILQLGRLYCLTGRYQEAVTVLRKGEKMGEGGRQSVGQGALERHLGEAYMALGENRKAMISLERASRHNPRDAAALSLLGEIYDSEKQGDEIALSLCRQAVKLDDSQWEYWYRLGVVQFHQGDAAGAAFSVRQSLALHRNSVPALCLAAEIAEKTAKRGDAARLYRKVLALAPEAGPALAGLARLAAD